MQSCLCSTPDIRSFHMGIVLPAFNALPRHLCKLMSWMQSGRDGATASALLRRDTTAAACDGIHPLPDLAPNESGLPAVQAVLPNSALSQGQRPPLPSAPPVHRPPLRGNWPFTVRPVASPAQPASRSTHSGRGFLAAPPSLHRRASVTSTATAESLGCRVPRAVRRFADPGSGRLAISGRMADVCAELDRLAAFEALQRHRGATT